MGWQRFVFSALGALAITGTALSLSAWNPSPLSETTPLVIHVRKSNREMWLARGNDVLRHFSILLGPSPTGGKLYRGDGRTPVGTYYISEKHPNSRWRRFLGISYPNIDDAERALSQRLITDDEWTDIFFANLQQSTPPQNTLMGGSVGIHGHGGRPATSIDWTLGCIAVSDSDIDYLYDTVPVGTAIEIVD